MKRGRIRSVRWTQRLTGAALVAAIALAAVSCGGDGDNETAESTSTTVPRGPEATATTAPGTPPTSPPLDLSELLLSAAEVGEGWSDEGTNTAEPGLAVCDKASPADIATLNEPPDNPELQRVFRSDRSSVASDSGPLKLMESILQDERAPEGIATLQRVFDACVGETWTELNMSTTLEPMAAPDLGDQAVAYLVIGTLPEAGGSPAQTWRGPLLIVQIDDMLLSLHAVDVQETGSTPRLTDEEFDAIAAKAVDKAQTQR